MSTSGSGRLARRRQAAAAAEAAAAPTSTSTAPLQPSTAASQANGAVQPKPFVWHYWERLALPFTIVLGTSLAVHGYFISALVVGAIVVIPQLDEYLHPGITDRLNQQ